MTRFYGGVDKDSERFFHGVQVKRYEAFAIQARRRMKMLSEATAISDLASIQGNRLERLRGDREGSYSIRINDQWRVCFRWTSEGPIDVEIVDYH